MRPVHELHTDCDLVYGTVLVVSSVPRAQQSITYKETKRESF